MPRFIAKLSKFGGQFRITIPKLLIEEMKWEDVEFVIMEDEGGGLLSARRFVDGESLKTKDERDRPGSD